MELRNLLTLTYPWKEELPKILDRFKNYLNERRIELED